MQKSHRIVIRIRKLNQKKRRNAIKGARTSTIVKIEIRKTVENWENVKTIRTGI